MNTESKLYKKALLEDTEIKVVLGLVQE